MNCKQCQEQIIEALYNELTRYDQQEFDVHIVSCRKCSVQYKQMQDTLDFMHQRERIDLDKALWEEQWKVLQNKIGFEQVKDKTIPFEKKLKWHPALVPAWAYVIAAMFLIVAGIFLGQTFWSGKTTTERPGSNPSISSNTTVEDSVTTQALMYLSKSKNLLLGVMNANDENYSANTMAKQQHVSRQLIQQASYFKNALDKPDQQQLKQLIHDLEIILMQLANIEVTPGVPAVEMVKRGVDQKSILFKINVEEIRSAVRELKTDKVENNKL
jgi:hypothetical protein